MGSFISSEKSFFYGRLKNTSKLAWPFGGFNTDLDLIAGVSLKFSDTLLRRYLHYEIPQDFF